MKMKPLGLVSFSAIAGLIVGAVAMATLRPTDYYGTQYPAMIRAVTAEHVLHAKLLRDGRSAEVLRMIESTFPSSVLHFDIFKLTEEGDLVQLWRIREYGEKHNLEYAAAAAARLASLPPKPGSYCDIEEAGKKKPPKSAPPTAPSRG